MSELIYFALVVIGYGGLVISALCGAETLLIYIALVTAVGNLIVGKVTTLFGFQVNPASCLAVQLFWAGILLNQYNGIRVARRALWYNIAALTFLTLIGCLAMHFPGGIVPAMDKSIDTLFHFMPNVWFGSIISFSASYLVTIFLQRKLRQHKGDDLSVATQTLLVAATNLLDIAICLSISYFGQKVDFTQVILMTWAARLVVIVIGMPVIYTIRRLYETGKYPLLRY
jgi:queuosine precursor transporter